MEIIVDEDEMLFEHAFVDEQFQTNNFLMIHYSDSIWNKISHLFNF